METDPKKIAPEEKPEKFSDQEEYYKIIKPIRTYERDLAEHVRNTNASKTEVNLKEQKRKREKPQNYKKKKEKVSNPKKIFVLVILIMISVAGLLFSVFGPNEKKGIVEETQITETNNFIIADQERNVDITNLNREELASLLERTADAEEVALKKITLFNLIISNQVTKAEIDPESFLRTIEVSAPSALLRSFGKRMDFGIFSLIRFSGFMILEVGDFSNVYAGMLKWEEGMPADLGGWISNEIPVNTSFSDATYLDKDLRVLRDSSGEIVLLYTFLNKKTLLITDKLETFEEILKRFK